MTRADRDAFIPMLIAQLTDLHVRPRGRPAYRVAETNALTARALDAVAALRPRPDLVIVTGDLTDNGLAEEYAELRRLLHGFDLPLRLIPGNHDRRDELRAAFPDRPEMGADGFVQFVHDGGPLRVVGLDSLVPGASHGELCEVRFGFLERALARDPAKPTLVALHHPPFACGIPSVDGSRLRGGRERLAAILRANPSVVRLACGHHHRPITATFAGVPAMIAPGVAHQVGLDFTGTEPSLVLEPPGYLLHRLGPDGLVSHGAYVERFPGPFPFVLDPDYPGAGGGR